MKEKYNVFPLLALASIVVVIGFILETAFHLSKFSFLSNLSTREVALTCINSLGLALIAVLLAALVLRVVFSVLSRQERLLGFLFSSVRTLLSLAAVAVVFTHIDTWVYTTFEHDVGSLPFVANLALLFSLLIAGVAVSVKHGESILRAVSAHRKVFTLSLVVFFLVFLASVGYNGMTKFPHLGASLKSGGSIKDLPNIIMLVPDGVPAGRLSTYGYERRTSPNLDFVAEQSLVFNRAYPNSGSSRASITSILTGKSPASTKVIYAPDILVGEDSYEHLPGILADLGYFCLTIGDGMHVSPRRINFQLGFHSENGESTGLEPGSVMDSRARRFFNLELYYLAKALGRITGKLGYMAGLSDELVRFRHVIQNFEGVNPLAHSSVENQLLLEFIEQIKNLERPIFAYLHLTRTHGPYFSNFVERKFSEGEQTTPGDPDFFDDAILTVDYIYATIINALKEAGKLDNTMVLYLTDHGKHFKTEVPLPLVVHLPGQEEKVEVDSPVQYMDIAPSILDYLGLGVPEWMEGIPLFKSRDLKYLDDRPAISLTSSHIVQQGRIMRGAIGPPFFGIGKVTLLRGGLLYTMDLDSRQENLYDISTAPHAPVRINDPAAATELRRKLLGFLKEKGIGNYINAGR